MQKKKILYVITKGNFGGAQKYVYDLATNLSLPARQAGKGAFDVVVACGSTSTDLPAGKAGASSDKEGNLLKKRLKEANIKVIDLYNSQREINLKKDWSVFRNLLKIIKEENPDIVHFNSSKIGFLGSLAILYFRILNLFHFSPTYRRDKDLEFRALFTSHGWAFNEQNRSFWSKIIFYIAHYLTALICDQTIAVSQKTKQDIAFLPFIKDKIKVIHNGIEDFDRVPKEEGREFLAKGNKNKIIIFSISELHRNKGLDIALRGISLLPEETKEKIIYVIAGSGEEKEKLEKLSEELKIENKVRFFGFVENAKKFLSGADIFLLPSRTENLPFAILEAGIARLPIIATNVGGIPEIIKDMKNGILVHRENPKEIAEAILYLLSHPEKQKEFGKEIKKTISTFFSLQKMLFETMKIY